MRKEHGTPGRDDPAEEPTPEPGRVDTPAGQSPMHSRDDDAADIEGKDIVQLGSEGSFPASDPPSWMSNVHPGRRTERPPPPKQPPGQ